MNKVTLSVVALAAIGAPVQSQAAEQTDAEKLQATYEEVCGLLNIAINEVNTYYDAVKTQYLSELSNLQKEIDAAKEAGAIDKAYFVGRIDTVKAAAKLRNDQYVGYHEVIMPAFNELTNDYNAALAQVQNGNYPNVGQDKKAWLESSELGYAALKAKIEALNPATQDDIYKNKEKIKGECKEMQDAIKAMLRGIDQEEANVASNEDAYTQVNDQVATLKTKYNQQLQALLKLLPGDPDVYGDWQSKAIEELNVEYRKILEVEKKNNAAHEAGNANSILSDNLNTLNIVEGLIGNIVVKWTDAKAEQETAYEARMGDVDALRASLKTITDALAVYELTDHDADVANINAKITTLVETIDASHKAHNVSDLNISSSKTEINTLIGKLDVAANKTIDNYVTNQQILAEITILEQSLADAKAAADIASEDGKYKASGYFGPSYKKIGDKIKTIKKDAETNFGKKTSVTYYNTASKYPKAKRDVENLINTYKADTQASLGYYNTAAKKIVDNQALVDKFAALANLNVTTDGQIKGEDNLTYQEVKDDAQSQIDAISTAITTANGKTDADHKNAMKSASEKTVRGDLQTLLDSYDANKTEFEKNSAIAAADGMLAEAESRIQALSDALAEATTGDFGNMKDEVDAAVKAQQDKLDELKQKVADQKDAYNNAAEDKKAEEAQKAISMLSDVNSALEEMTPDVEAAKQLAIKARNNKTAYDATKTAVTESGIAGKLTDAQAYITANTTGDGQVYYLNELAKLSVAKDELDKAIEKSYTDKKSAENKDGHIKTLNSLVSAVETLQTNAINNETMHNAQVLKIETLQNEWQKAYTNISENDESTKAKEYLAQLGTLQNAINTLNANVAEAFRAGNSKAKDGEFSTEITRITNEINAIVLAQNEGYNAAITADNIAQHELFKQHYNSAYKKFQDAVAALNEFAKIQKKEIKDKVESLVETHDVIYGYADKLRQLSADESADYGKFTAPDLYNSEEWVSTADQYSSEIETKLKAYQKEVNDCALDLYKDKIVSAVNTLSDAKDAVEGFDFVAGDEAFADVEEFVSAAQTAAGLTGGDVDPMFATKIDTWITQFDKIDDMLDADKEVAAENEFNGHHDARTKLYNEEKTAIGKLANLSTDYLAQLDERKVETIDYAQGMFVDGTVAEGMPALAEKKFDRLTDCLAALNKFYSSTGTPVIVDDKSHSDIYKYAKDESTNSTANLTAYKEMIKKLDDLESDLNEAKNDIDPLFNVHTSSSIIYGKFDSQNSSIQLTRTLVENWKERGLCTSESINDTFNYRNDRVKRFINSVRTDAINNEIAALGEEINLVKEEYNTVASLSPESLDAVKVYDAQIARLDSTLYATPSAQDAVMKGKGIEFLWNNGTNDEYQFAAAKKDLVALQGEISRIGRELTAMHDAQAIENALSELNARAAELDALLAELKVKVNYHKDITDRYGKYLSDFETSLSAVKADVEAKTASNDILFYKDNLMADFDRAKNKFSDTNITRLNTMYEKYVTNDNVYNTIKAAFEAQKERLNEVKAVADTFGASHLEVVYDPATQTSSEVEYRNLQYDNITTYIITQLGNLANAHDNVILTENDVEGATDNVSAQILQYEKTVKYDEANLTWLANLWQKYNDARSALIANSNDGLSYAETRYDDLCNRLNSMQDAYHWAYVYNNNAYNDDYVYNDIDGNDISVYNEQTGLNEPVSVDYIAVAWPAVKAKVELLLADVEQISKDINDWAFVLGDIDNDKMVTVNDYSTVRNWILTSTGYEDENLTENQRFAGDVNGDKSFTVADITQISNIIFYGNRNGQSPTLGVMDMNPTVDNSGITLAKQSEETTLFGKTVRVAVCVGHNVAFTAGQFDVKLPEGMKLSAQSLTERSSNHELLCNEIENGTYRMVVSNIENNMFVDRSGALVLLDIEVQGNYNGDGITITNAIFADANGVAYNLTTPANGNTNGVDGITTAPTVKERIYSVGGQVKNALVKGINIIVGDNGKAKKVIK